MTNKTPSYTLKAVAKYEKIVVKKSLVINPRVDAELLEAIKNDEIAFSTRVKLLLKDYLNQQYH